jgi:phage terminase large subunit-like protein
MRRRTNPVDQYAKQVVAGKVPAGKYHRLACERHLRDRARENTPGFPFVFVWDTRTRSGRLGACALRFLTFARRMKHYKGKKWAGKPFDPSPCQVFRLGSLFGWRHVETNRRRFTTAYNELPRKQGKSFEAAIVLIYVTFFEGEAGAEGYVIATKRAQASIVFGDARRLVQTSRVGSGRLSEIVINAASLYHERTASRVQPLGADSDSTDGLNPNCTVADELHAYRDRGLLDVMESGTGARENPLMFQITTAGSRIESPGGDQHTYACSILDQTIADDATESFFAFIAHADVDDDWTLESTWRKAMPHYGVSVQPDEVRKLALKAKNIPSAAAEFQQKLLNWWVATANPCLDVGAWRSSQSATWTAADMEHEPCFIGIDLASLLDLCALSIVFPPAPGRPAWRVLQHIWTPEATLVDRAHRDRAPYTVWRDQGWLTTSPGTRIDHQLLRPVLREARERFDVEQIGFDPWHADTLIDQLKNEDGFRDDQVVAVPQTFAGMSRACLRVQADVTAQLVDARGCPVTTWAVGNVVANVDGKGNLMFAKGKSRGRIDPVIAATIGVSLALRKGNTAPPDYQIIVFGGPPQ